MRGPITSSLLGDKMNSYPSREGAWSPDSSVWPSKRETLHRNGIL